jgi:hypothetical protein
MRQPVGIPNNQEPPRLTIAQILARADAHHQKAGKGRQRQFGDEYDQN